MDTAHMPWRTLAFMLSLIMLLCRAFTGLILTQD